MAENKKSFLLYADIIHTIKKLPKDKAGEVFMLILDYINDNNPDINNYDLLVQITFEPIRQQLKRDLKHWESIRNIRSENGKKGGRPIKAKKANGFLEKQTKAKKAVNDNVNVTVNDNVNVKNDKNILLLKIQEEFYDTLTHFFDEFGKELVEEFYKYWSEPNKSKTKIRWQLEKTWDVKRRLERWSKNNFNKSKQPEQNKPEIKTQNSKQEHEYVIH